MTVQYKFKLTKSNSSDEFVDLRPSNIDAIFNPEDPNKFKNLSSIVGLVDHYVESTDLERIDTLVFDTRDNFLVGAPQYAESIGVTKEFMAQVKEHAQQNNNTLSEEIYEDGVKIELIYSVL